MATDKPKVDLPEEELVEETGEAEFYCPNEECPSYDQAVPEPELQGKGVCSECGTQLKKRVVEDEEDVEEFDEDEWGEKEI